MANHHDHSDVVPDVQNGGSDHVEIGFLDEPTRLIHVRFHRTKEKSTSFSQPEGGVMKSFLSGERREKALLLPGGHMSPMKGCLVEGPDHLESPGIDVVEDFEALEEKGRTQVVAGGIQIRQRPYSGIEQTFSEHAGSTPTHATDDDGIFGTGHR